MPDLAREFPIGKVHSIAAGVSDDEVFLILPDRAWIENHAFDGEWRRGGLSAGNGEIQRTGIYAWPVGVDPVKVITTAREEGRHGSVLDRICAIGRVRRRRLVGGVGIAAD